jgi:hypothetical protein
MDRTLHAHCVRFGRAVIYRPIPENTQGVCAKTDATGRDMHRDIDAEKAAYSS